MPSSVRKTALKVKRAPRDPYRKMTDEEIRLARMCFTEDIMEPSEIAGLLRRDKSTLTRRLVMNKERRKQGRPILLDDGAVDELVSLLDFMVVSVDGRCEVTVVMLRRKARSKAGTRTISDALHKRRIYFRRLREKPVLTADDIANRKAFATAYKSKGASWWLSFIDMHIDVKHFPVYLNGRARAHAAREGVRGSYCTPGQGLDAPHVKHGKKYKYNPGARGIMVLAGVGHGKVLVWEEIDGRNWNGNVAAEMYAGPIKNALERACPVSRKWRVLEDNDPAGFKCRKGVHAKQAVGIESFDIPRRSPSLNVCDYALWSEINRRMRAAEAKWPKDRTESRKQYIARLRRTALSLPEAFVNKSISNMQQRCQSLHAARGGHFEEGGRRCRYHDVGVDVQRRLAVVIATVIRLWCFRQALAFFRRWLPR